MTKLNFACGPTRWPGFDNSDIHDQDGTSHVDLEVFPYPYADESAELILLSHALQMTSNGSEPVHPDKRPILREFHRILAPAGWLRLDDNPMRIVDDHDDIPANEVEQEARRGFPDRLKMHRADLVAMLHHVGFASVTETPPTETRIPCDAETRAAIVGNHIFHISFALEAQK